jgi:Concanavalin A-like lectin/glucanases superfamily/Secretion system C-terminal sorting domain
MMLLQQSSFNQKICIMKNLATSFCKSIVVLLCLFSLHQSCYSQTGTHVNFDGANDYADCPAISVANQSFSIEFWAKRQSGIGQYQYFFSQGTGSANQFVGILFRTSNVVSFAFWGNDLDAVTAITDLNWHHYAFTYNATTKLQAIYIDGVLNASRTATANTTAAGSFYIGGFLGTTQTLNANLDEFRIWNYTLSAQDVSVRKNCELAGNEAGLLRYYKFNQGIGGGNNTAITSLADATVNAGDGTLINFSLTGASSNWLTVSPAPIKSTGTHLNFDGVDDFIAAPVVLPTTNTTVELWFKTTNPNAGLFTVTTNTSGYDRDLYLNGGNIYSYVYSPTVFLNTTGTNYADGNWHHLAQVISSTSGEFIYVDGVLKASNAAVTSSGFNWNTQIYIGRSLISGQFSNADIDEVRIWNVVRTAPQLTSNCPLVGNEAGLMAYYRFDQGLPTGNNATVTTLQDATANNNNGVLSGFALSGNTSNWQILSPVVTGPDVTTPITYCHTSPATALTAPGTGLLWYTSQFSGTGSSTAPTPSTAATGTTSYWVTQSTACGESPRSRIDVTVNPQSLANTNSTRSLNVGGTTYFNNNCSSVIATISPSGASPISGSTTAKVWIESTQPADYVLRHYEITPVNNAGTATGIVTLYFTQFEFDQFNGVNTTKLPNNPGDAVGIANLRIEKISGVSSDGSGLPGAYSGSTILINPADTSILYNYTHGRWEVSFDVTGFSGFFVKSSNITLPANWLNVNAVVNNNKQAVINWKVSETNVTRYEVEKSLDGRNFTAVAKASSKGDGTNSYSVTDSQALYGTAWYRIKQVDQDEKFSYSIIVRLYEKISSQISVYPNPFIKSIMVNSGKQQLAVLMDVTGKTVKKMQLQRGVYYINVEALTSGLYILKLGDGNNIKLIKE